MNNNWEKKQWKDLFAMEYAKVFGIRDWRNSYIENFFNHQVALMENLLATQQAELKEEYRKLFENDFYIGFDKAIEFCEKKTGVKIDRREILTARDKSYIEVNKQDFSSKCNLTPEEKETK